MGKRWHGWVSLGKIKWGGVQEDLIRAKQRSCAWNFWNFCNVTCLEFRLGYI
jgi:hypothetical protein